MGKHKVCDRDILSVCGDSEPYTDLQSLSRWTQKIDRGGLRYASKDFSG